jgi:hypothetical protein
MGYITSSVTRAEQRMSPVKLGKALTGLVL